MTTEEILVETLDELSPEDFDQFKLLLHTEGLSFITSERLKEANTEDVVKLLLELNRKDCVEETRKVLLKMERTDLVQRLSRIDSRAKEQQQIPLSHRVELMVSVIELLLETLADLTDIQLRDFHYHLDEIHPFRSDLDWPLTVMEDLNLQDTVFTLVQSFGQRSVNVTMEVLQKMEMTDLRKRLSDSSSGRTKKHSVDEHQSALIQKVATMAAVKQLLVETLEHLPYWELNRFMVHLQSIVYQRNPSYVPRTDIGMNYTSLSSDILDMMMEELGLQSLEVTREILEKMNRTDLVQRFLKTSSELKASSASAGAAGGNLTTGEQQQIPLSHRVELMVSVIELLLETLADLTDIQLIDFHHHLSGIHSLRYDYMSKLMKHYTDLQDTVLTLVQRFGQRSVEVTMKVLQKMKMTDLMKRLSDSSSGPTKKPLDEHLSAQIHKVATLAAIRELLLETLKDLSEQELSKVQWLLQFTCFQKNLPQLSVTGDSAAVVDQMMRTCGQQSLEVIMEVLMDMNRTDLVQRLSETSSGPKVKHSVDEHWPALIQKVELMVSVIELLLETLADLTDIQLRRFHHHMSGIHPLRSDLDWPLTVMDDRFSFMFSLMQHHTDLQDTVFTLVQRCGHQSVEVTMEVLQKMEMTDLMKRLSDSSSGPTKKLSVDELQSALIQKVATMAAVKQLLVETLEHLPYWELNRFMVHLQSIVYQRNPSYVPRTDIGMNYTSLSSDILDMMMKELGLQSMEVTREILEKMNRTDLVQRFLKSRSEFKASSASAGAAGGNLTTGEQQQIPLSHRVELMVSVIELLLETLADLTDIQLRRFHHHLDEIHSLRYDYMSSLIQHYTDLQDTVFTLVQRFGQRSVEVTMKVLQKMKMTDLMKRLSDSSSGRTKKPLDEHLSVQIHKVATLAAIRELLLETLKDLSKQELSKVQWLLQYTCFQKNLPQIPPRESVTGDSAAVVDQMMTTCGQQSLEVIMEVLMDMNRTDLVQRLSETSSGPKVKHSVDEHWPALIQKVELMVSVIELLLETLADLTDIQLRDFHRHMSGIHPLRSDLDWPLTVMDDRFSFMFSLMQHHTDLQDTVFTLVQRFGHQSVEVTMEVLQKMEMTDLRKRLSDSSSGPTKKLSVDEHQSALIQKVATMAAVKQLLVETLEHLPYWELNRFMVHLQRIVTQRNPSYNPLTDSGMSFTSLSSDILDMMMKELGLQSLEVTREILEKMNRTDLVQRFLKTSSELKEPSSSLDPEGSVKQDSRNWTKVEPVVNRTDEAKAPTYSLQSEAGHFECAVSGLRWVCEEKASLKYHFCSWEGHMEWMEHMHYMPAGSLMDVTVMTGKLKEVYLPHWICIDDIPDILNQFAVLHVNDCGDEVEEVSEVTASHVKLKEPIFSPRAVLMRAGLPVKINCNVLIYQTNTAFLTLHVYLIPQDGGLKQTITQEELSEGGCKKIRKPKPEKSLKMKSFFLLTADVDGARITPPEGLKLRYDTDPNFFEVHIKNPNRDFQLNLTQKNELQSVWTCFVQEGDYQSPYPPQASSASAGAAGGNMTTEGKHFVDEHQLELIRRVSNIKPILDELLVKGVIQEEAYATITAMSTCEDKMRALYIGPLKAGVACKDVFYETLKTHEKYLITDLNKGQ
ncbi:uncharacterized protein LOC125015984 isoform X10 [Mugil cephalus]|uniref:uncharacterized protein LOC125015984 isoform X10 n=1 Tax=Mugil cephalus TaxID=48193 RepID=UPI001FB6A988|nr:uncharacterized protein LOC125015984 isoform X10 [Mugil cephalus]